MGRGGLVILAWLLILNGLFLLPALALPGDNPWFSPEALVVWAVICGLRVPQQRYRVAQVLAVLYGLLVLLVLVDALVRESLGRGLNLYLEFGLLDAAWNLLDTNLGGVLAVLALGALAAVLVGIGWLFHYGLDRLGHHDIGIRT